MEILVLDYLSYTAHKNFNKIHIDSLLKLGHNLHLVGKKGQFDNIINSPQIKISILSDCFFGNYSPLVNRVIYILCLLWSLLKYRPSNYDLIIIPTYDPMSIWVYRTTKKLILITHDVHYLDNKIKFYAVKSLPSHYIHVGLSKDMSDRLEELYPYKNIKYIPHGLCPVSNEIKKPSCLNNINNPYILCPINSKYNAEFVELLFSDKNLLDYLQLNGIVLVVKENLIKREVNSDNIIKIGKNISKPEYDYLLKNASIVILPYENEYKYRCSGILFECVIRDIPVLATNIKAMSVYLDNINIKLFDSPDELIQGIEYFRTNNLKEIDKTIFNPYNYWIKTLY